MIFATGPTIPNTRIAGTLYDWVLGLAARNGAIEAIALPDSIVYVARADTAGRFVLAHLPPGSYTVRGWVDANNNRGFDPREAYDSASVTLARYGVVDAARVRARHASAANQRRAGCRFGHVTSRAQPAARSRAASGHRRSFRLTAPDSSRCPAAPGALRGRVGQGACGFDRARRHDSPPRAQPRDRSRPGATPSCCHGRCPFREFVRDHGYAAATRDSVPPHRRRSAQPARARGHQRSRLHHTAARARRHDEARSSPMSDPRRALPSVNALLESDAVRPLLSAAPRELVVNAVRDAVAAARNAAEAPRDADEWSAAIRDALATRQRRSLRPRHQRHRRHSAHEPRPRAARIRGARRDARRRRGILQPRVRSRPRCTRIAVRALRRSVARAHGRRGCARRQQRRGGAGARAQLARRSAAGHRVARRAHRDRRKLPHSRHHGEERRPPRRGRDDEPHASGRLRARARGRWRHRQGPSQQLRARGLRDGRVARRSRSPGGTSRRSGAARPRQRASALARGVRPNG